jgi:hypothetical protein
MMIRRPTQRRGARLRIGGLGDALSDKLGFPTTGNLITWDQLWADRATALTLPDPTVYAAGIPAGAEANEASASEQLSVLYQQAYIRSLFDLATQQPAQPGGMYYEVNYPAYVVSSTVVPSWEQAYLASQAGSVPAGDVTPLQALAQYPSFTNLPASAAPPAAVVAASEAVDFPTQATATQPAAAAGGSSASPISAGSPAASSSAAGSAGGSANQTTAAATTGLSSIPWWVWAIGGAALLWYVMERQ